MLEKKKVLVTAIGTVTATAIVIELKKTGNYYIIGADINPKEEIATSLDVNEYYVFPYAASDNYVNYVLDFCKKQKIDYYFAVIDIEVVRISKERRRFSDIGTKLCVVNYEFAEICHFKNIFSEWIDKNIPEISIRTYKNYNELTKYSFPVFVKPIEGVASSGCKKIETMKALQEVVSEEQFNREILVQEFTEGYNITVDLMRNKKSGQKIQIQRRELCRNKNGCGIAVVIINIPELAKICDFLMDKLDLNGVANAEFFFKNGEYKIIEINPRFSAGSRYSCMAGVNTVLNAIAIVDEKNCHLKKIAVGKHFAERYEVYQMD